MNRGTPVYCEVHLAEYYSANRSRYPRTRYGSNWSRIRDHYLFTHKYCECSDRECQVCYGSHQGKEVEATDVDHRVRFVRWSNKTSAHKLLQSLCKQCHSSKTNREVRGLI